MNAFNYFTQYNFIVYIQKRTTPSILVTTPFKKVPVPDLTTVFFDFSKTLLLMINFNHWAKNIVIILQTYRFFLQMINYKLHLSLFHINGEKTFICIKKYTSTHKIHPFLVGCTEMDTKGLCKLHEWFK